MSSSTRKKTIFNRFGTRSVAYETLLWMFLWGLYGLWAGFSPAYPESKHSEPFFPLVIFAFMAACFFLFGDREELKLLIANSLQALVIVPGLLVLNFCRLFRGGFPETWHSAGFLFSRFTFFLIQFFYLFLTVLLVRYTGRRCKASPPVFTKRDYVSLAVVASIFVLLGLLVLFFVFAGRS